MRVEWLLAAAALLSLERVCYAWIARAPATFRRLCQGSGIVGPGGSVAAVAVLFGTFKILQLSVFVAWSYVHGHGRLWPTDASAPALGLGAALLVAGQILSVSVFYRLGWTGAFFGDRFGVAASWCRAFPFTWFAHPQYVGAVLSIWGLFLVMRFPHRDWLALPVVETVYYTAGAWLETAGSARQSSNGPNRVCRAERPPIESIENG